MSLPPLDGMLIFVESVSDYFRLELDSTYVVDGVNVLGCSIPNARLERLYVRDLRWADQAAWYIDPVGGDNNNDGASPASALQSHQELEARLDRINQSITVTYLNEPAASDFVRIDFTPDRHSDGPFDIPTVTYVGFRTPLLSSTFTAVAAATPSAAVPEATLVTDAATASFAAYVGKCIVVTSGAAAGAIAWIAKATAANKARVSPFYFVDFFSPSPLPAPGDSYQICDAMALPTVTATTQQLVSFQNCRIAGGSLFYGPQLVAYFGCDLDDVGLSAAFIVGCRVHVTSVAVQIANTVCTVDGSLIDTTRPSFMNQVNESGFVEIVRSIMQGPGTGTAILLGRPDPGGLLSMTDVGFFDFGTVISAAGGANLNLNPGTFPITGPSIWGASIATSGVDLDGNTRLQHGNTGLPGNFPNFDGPGPATLRIGGVNTAWGALPLQDPTTGVSAVTFAP